MYPISKRTHWWHTPNTVVETYRKETVSISFCSFCISPSVVNSELFVAHCGTLFAGQMGVGDGSVFHCLASLASLEPQGSSEVHRGPFSSGNYHPWQLWWEHGRFSKKWISRKPTTFSQIFDAKATSTAELLPTAMLCGWWSCCTCFGRNLDRWDEDNDVLLQVMCGGGIVASCLACEYTQSSHFFIHPPLVFQDLSYSQYSDVPPKERFPDNDRTVCRFGRVITGATIEDDGTEGGISQFLGRLGLRHVTF